MTYKVYVKSGNIIGDVSGSDNDDDKQQSNKQQATSNKQQATSDKQQATSNKQQHHHHFCLTLRVNN